VNDTVFLDLDADTWARWDAEADRRGIPVEVLVREAVDAEIDGRRWNGEERRRDRASVLEATRTAQEEHRP
jgi:hypothetical protein